VEQHVKILAWLNIVFGGLGVLVALFVLVFFGGLAIVSTDNDPGAQGVLGAIGGIAFILIAALSLPCIVAGIGLLKFRSWAQILTIIMSVLSLVSFPFGTALGVYGLWVLLNKETKPLFRTA
jgi:hypothetical protein